MRKQLVVLVALAATMSGCGGSDDPGLTPHGAATLWSPWLGVYALPAHPREVLTGVRVHVGPDGHSGLVRVRVLRDRGDGHGATLVGPWRRLPAHPGDVVLPTPRLTFDDADTVIGLDQRSGGLAIIQHEACEPKLGEYADPCEVMELQLHRPVMPDLDVPVRSRADEVVRGSQLDIEPITARDVDGDLAPDATTDRTRLHVDARVVRRARGALTLAVTLANDGPRSADAPELLLRPAFGVGLGRWSTCVNRRDPVYVGLPLPGIGAASPSARDVRCSLDQLRVGDERTVRVTLPDIGAQALHFQATAEGPVLNPRTATTDVHLAGPPAAAAVSAPTALPRYAPSLRVVTPYAGVVDVRVGAIVRRRVQFHRPGARTIRLHLSSQERRALTRGRFTPIVATQRGRSVATVIAG